MKINQTQRRYTLTAGDLEELKSQLRRDVLPKESGGSHGRTISRIDVSYEFEETRKSCRLISAEVTLHITISLPVWEPRKPVPATLHRRWEALLAALAQHEATHAGNARAAAEEIRAGLMQLAPQLDCRSLERAAQRNFDRVILKLELKDQRFDQRTGAGTLAGVVL